MWPWRWSASPLPARCPPASRHSALGLSITIRLLRKPSSSPSLQPYILQVNMLSKLPVFFLCSICHSGNWCLWRYLLSIWVSHLSSRLSIPWGQEMLHDVSVCLVTQIWPGGYCKYLPSDKWTTFKKFMFKTRTAKHWLLKMKPGWRAGLESRDTKRSAESPENLNGGAEEGGTYHWVTEEREGSLWWHNHGNAKVSMKNKYGGNKIMKVNTNSSAQNFYSCMSPYTRIVRLIIKSIGPEPDPLFKSWAGQRALVHQENGDTAHKMVVKWLNPQTQPGTWQVLSKDELWAYDHQHHWRSPPPQPRQWGRHSASAWAIRVLQFLPLTPKLPSLVVADLGFQANKTVPCLPWVIYGEFWHLESIVPK